jgi:hypothetical protein
MANKQTPYKRGALDRCERLAAALRDNLKKRKAQAQARQAQARAAARSAPPARKGGEDKAPQR